MKEKLSAMKSWIKKNDYIKLVTEFYDNLNSYTIEECIELAIPGFDICSMELEIYEKIEKKYRYEDEISKKVLTFQINRCQSNRWFYEDLIGSKFEEIHNNNPNKAKLEKKVKSRNIKKCLFKQPQLAVEFVAEELERMPVEKRIKYYTKNYELYSLILDELRKNLYMFYKRENIKRRKIAFLEYECNLLQEKSFNSYDQACHDYFLVLPLDHLHRKHIKESILGSNSYFMMPTLKTLLFSGKEGYLFEEVYNVLLPEIPEFGSDVFAYIFFSDLTFDELKYGNLDIIEFLRSVNSEFDSSFDCLFNLPSDIFRRREELLIETIKSMVVYYKKYIRIHQNHE